MIEIRPFDSLGKAQYDWLDTSHHFSFAEYRDPDRMGWGRIRVWNDDVIAPRSGFPPHPHSDMEIVTFVRAGAISHRDSLGNEGRTEAGDVQVMSAGSGITHAEFNRDDAELRLFQIWIMPDRRGEPPSWSQRPFPREQRAGRWVTLASGAAAPDGGEILPLRADARVMAATLRTGETLAMDSDPRRHFYLVPTGGEVRVNGNPARARDGVAITGEERIEIAADGDCELLLVETA